MALLLGLLLCGPFAGMATDRWAVAEFRDIKEPRSTYGRSVAEAFARALNETKAFEVIAPDVVGDAVRKLGVEPSLESLVSLGRVGEELRATTIVRGEVVDYRFRAGRVQVALRIVAYDVATLWPINGVLLQGESGAQADASQASLMVDAVRRTAALAVEEMAAHPSRTATLLNTIVPRSIMNEGARAGFRVGDRVFVSRGKAVVGAGRVIVVEPDQAGIALDDPKVGFAPGDRVRSLFVPPGLTRRGAPFLLPQP